MSTPDEPVILEMVGDDSLVCTGDACAIGGPGAGEPTEDQTPRPLGA